VQSVETASLDLEIIAQGETDEKHADDRKEVLEDHQQLKACRRNGRAFVSNFARAEEKFFDFGPMGTLCAKGRV
jgi:hypothetical protein